MSGRNRLNIYRNRVVLDLTGSFIANFLSLFVGFTSGIVVTAIVAGLAGDYKSIDAAIFGSILLFLLILVFVAILIFLCLLHETYKYSKYSVLLVNLLGMLAAHFVTRDNYKSNSIPFFCIIMILYLTINIISNRAWENKSRWQNFASWAIYCGAIGRFSYYQKDLTEEIFEGEDLRNIDLRASLLPHTSFIGAKNLHLALTKGTILEDKRVRDLLVDPQSGQGKNFSGADFTGAYLVGANLQGANLTGANLQDANLTGANLAAANLRGVNAIDTDFTGAILHDVCIQDWNISKKTTFANVQCRGVYLKEDQQEPKPDSYRSPHGKEFQAGEFEKWVKVLTNTIDLIFQNGLDLKSLAFAITQASIDYENTQFTAESIEHKGDGVVVVKVSSTGKASKSELHIALTNEYKYAQDAIAEGREPLLRAYKDEISQLTSKLEVTEQNLRAEKSLRKVDKEISETYKENFQGLIACMAQPIESRSVTINKYYSTQQGDIMEGQKIQAGGNVEQGNRITAGGDFNSTGSNINLDEQNGDVNISLQQLQDIQTSSSQELVKALASLQNAINEDTTISEVKKGELLEKVKVLAEEGKKEEKQREKNIVEKAIAGIQSINEWLGSGSKLVQACQTYLPTISKIFGI
jgi:uncharacterized protein YjbI with pentapeptide repeats